MKILLDTICNDFNSLGNLLIETALNQLRNASYL